MSDKLRILARLELGPVSPIDFQLPNVCDGGKPILRVAARVQDLRDAGYEITSSRAKNGTAVYKLGGLTAAERSEGACPASAAEMSIGTLGHAETVPSSPAQAATAPSVPVDSLFDAETFRPGIDRLRDVA